ncbi:MAG: ABC transporter permease [Anaerolineales bacterium]|nr:ABC transporter permease [Anaerolineales bacterium]
MAREIPGVEAVEGTSSVSARIVHTDGTMVQIIFIAAEDPADLTLNYLKPAPDDLSIPVYGDKETIIDLSAVSLGYEPGDLILVELGDGKQREVKLAGYMHAVTGIPYNLAQQVYAYVTPDTLEWLGGTTDGYDRLSISVAEKQTDAEHVTAVAQAVADKLERAGSTVFFVSVYQPGHHFAYSITQGVFFVLGILGYLTVLLSGFLIVNTITALMTQQTRQIGIMKATGGSGVQIFFMYMTLIVAFGIGALLLAVPLANAAATNIGGGMATWLNFFAAPYKGYGTTIIQQVLVAIVIPLLAALLPIYNSVRITVREALSDYGLCGNAKAKEETTHQNSVLIPRPIRISLRNTFRRKTRLGLTLFTLVLGGAVFIAVYNLWASFDKTIEDIQGYFLADINISFDRGYRFDKVASIAQSIPGVVSAEGWLEYTGTVEMNDDDAGTQILFVAPPSTSILIDPIITSGLWLEQGDENAIVIGNHLLQVYPDLKVGDSLTIDIDGKKTEWTIVGTYSITGNVSPPLLYVNYEYLSVLVGEPEMAYSLRIITDPHDSATQGRINDQNPGSIQATRHSDPIHAIGRRFHPRSKSTDGYPRLFYAGHGNLDRHRWRAGADGNDEHQRPRTYSRDRRHARHWRQQRRHSSDRHYRRYGHWAAELGDQHSDLRSHHERALLRRWHGDPDRPHARRLRRDGCHRLADLHHRAGYARQRPARTARLAPDSKRHTGIRINKFTHHGFREAFSVMRDGNTPLPTTSTHFLHSIEIPAWENRLKFTNWR